MTLPECNMIRASIKALLLTYVVLSLSFGQSDVELRTKRIEQGLLPAVLIKGEPAWTIQDRMKHYKAPGVTVAVINNFKVEWAKAYGVKDVETNEPVNTETLFQAGSISKSVAAMVALKKVQDGKISLDEDINKKLVSWKLPENEFTATKKVTLANLSNSYCGAYGPRLSGLRGRHHQFQHFRRFWMASSLRTLRP